MTIFADGESGLSVRTKINNVLQHADGTTGELVINDAGADVDFRVESDTVANALFVDGATGKVGLGTGTPSFNLDVSSTSTDTARFNTSASYNFIRLSSSSRNWALSTGAAFGVYDETAATTRLTIDSTGRLLIGTTFATGANLLQVNSDARINGLTVGLGAGAIASSTALGTSALGTVNTGTGNTAIGALALTNNTTGTSNTGLGRQTLYTNTTGVNNIGIGENALFNNTTGANNIAAGNVALFGNTTGGGNAAFGYAALYTNTTASNNTGIGFQALQFSTTGVNNTAVGSTAMNVHTTGNNNTSVGTSSLLANTTGSNNTVIGQGAGLALTTGDNNTIIGRVAGTAGLANTVIIGAGATERLRIDSGGNMGLGVAPSAWAPAWKAAQVGGFGAFAAHVSVGAVRINSNAFDDGAEKYIGSTFATKYEQYEGQHKFFTAPSGTAGAAITFTNAMTLDASGNLLVGTTSAGGSTSNAAKMVGGVHSTVSGNIASLTTATPATMFTISGGVPSQVWMVSSDLDGEATPSYQCVYMVTYTSSNSVTATQLVKGSLASITVSGLNVQYTQASGGTKTNNRWSAVRIL